MKRSVLLTSIVALSAFFSLTSCNNAGGDTTTPPVGGTTTPGGDDTPVEPFDGWADEDAAHVAQEYKGVANSGEEGINLSGISASYLIVGRLQPYVVRSVVPTPSFSH